jgi:putative toxin-antitoxin system antitoxin component (TIGR02293 family)
MGVNMSQGSLMESGYYARIIEDLRETALTAAELAAITGVKERQVQHWAAGSHRPAGTKRDRLLELAYIVDRLRDVYRPEGIDIWLHGRNRGLGGQRPIDLLESGEFGKVLNAIERLETGAM